MPGMLTEKTSSGPLAPTATPGAGAPLGGTAPGPGQPTPNPAASEQAVQQYKEKAIQLVYGDRFDQLIKMFQTNGPDKFARSMAIAVNTAITEIEKESGPIGPEAAAAVGGDLFAKLLEDMLLKPEGGKAAVVEGVTGEQLSEVMPAILVMYADSHPDVSKQDIQAVMKEVTTQTQAAAGGGQPVPAQTPVGNQSVPGKQPMPPGGQPVPGNQPVPPAGAPPPRGQI